MPDEIGNQEPVFCVFSGPCQETVAHVNSALEYYAVVSWTWSVVKDAVILSALLVSQREVRKAQLAMSGPPMGGHRQ